MPDYVKYESILRSHLVRKERSTDGKDRYVAWFPQLEGCRVQGDTAEAAVEMLYEILPAYIAGLRAVGAPESRIGSDLENADRVKSGFKQTLPWPARFVQT